MLTIHGLTTVYETDVKDLTVSYLHSALGDAIDNLKEMSSEARELADLLYETVEKQMAYKVEVDRRMMMLKGGSPAFHKMGNIGRDNDDRINIHYESDNHYMGVFCEGFGFINVIFNKEDVRPLTVEEIDKINGMYFGINNQPYHQISIDENGYYKESVQS